MTLIQSRRVFKTIVLTFVVAAALMAYGASAQPNQTTTPPVTQPAPAAVAPAPPVVYPYPTHYYNNGNRAYLGLNDEGYTETTRATDQYGNTIKTKREVEIDDDETTVKTTVVGPDGVISKTKTEIEAD